MDRLARTVSASPLQPGPGPLMSPLVDARQISQVEKRGDPDTSQESFEVRNKDTSPYQGL